MRRAALLAAALLAVAQTAQADTTKGSFEQADTDHDGRVTLQEFAAYASSRLSAEGPATGKLKQLTPEEQAERLRQRFEQLDNGHKGYLDRSDWAAGATLLSAALGRGARLPNQGLTLGAGLADVDPGYVGYHHRLDPFPLISYRSGRFYLAGTSAGWVAFRDQTYALSVALVPEFMRVRASDSPEFAGLRTREWTIDGGLDLSVRQPWGNLSFAALHDVLDRNNGTELSAGYGFPIRLGATRTLTPGLGLKWQSASLVDYYYGVTTPEALPDRPAYSPGAALEPSVRLDYAHRLSSQWQLAVGMSYTRFDRSIRDSPLIDRSGSLALRISLQWSAVPGSRMPSPGPFRTPLGQ